MNGNETHMGPDDLIGREFAIGLRGYDRDEVDAFLLRAAEAWRDSMAAAPSLNGLSSSAMAALADSEPSSIDDLMPPAPPVVDTPIEAPADPFASPAPFAAPMPLEPSLPADPFAAPAPVAADDPFAAPTPPPAEARSMPDLFVPVTPDPPAPAHEVEAAPAAEAPAPSRSEVERDRATAYAERVAAELDRASARTELAQAQEESLKVVDAAQRRAEAVLTGARARAQAEAEAILEDARSRLTPLLEQERAARARIIRLRQDLDAISTDAPVLSAPALPDAASLVTSTEDDPDTPEATFPVGYGSVTVG